MIKDKKVKFIAIRIPSELYDQCIKKTIERTIQTGKIESVSSTIREAITKFVK